MRGLRKTEMGSWVVDVGMERVEVEPNATDGAWLTIVDERGKDAGVILLDREAGVALGDALARWGRTGKVEEEVKVKVDGIPWRTEKEREIVEDPAWIEGASWGEPRPGHPEGKVLAHILEVLANIDTAEASMRRDLRLIALVHDTFKGCVDQSRPKEGENHHAMIARRFEERHELGPGVLDVIELHDEAYNAWRAWSEGRPERAAERALRLIDRLGDNERLFTAFYRCDNETGDKSREPLLWWLGFVDMDREMES